MSRTYFAYANSLNGTVDFSTERGNDHRYFGRFTDNNDRAELWQAVNSPVVVGGGRNLALLSDIEKTPNVGEWIANYALSAAVEEGRQYVVSADILLNDASTPTPKVVFCYNPDTTYSDIAHDIVDSWARYTDSEMPLLASGQDEIAVDGRFDADYECLFKVKNVKVELGAMATAWTPAPEDVLAVLDAKINNPNSYAWQEIRNSINADWWSNLGVVRSKAVLTFADNTSVTVYGTDYIKAWKVSQDLSSGNDRPVFDFVSDKLELTLYSLDNDFNPFAENSQYYGKFVLGTKISLFTTIDYLGHGDELNWVALGQYKIAEINVSETGTECEILAYDYGYDGIENSKQQILAPLRDVESSQDIEDFFDDVFPDYTVFVQEGVADLPKKLFPLGNKLETMNEFLAALYCFSRCNGNQISIRSFDAIQRALLDKTNIVSLKPEQSLVRRYDASVVRWNEIGLQSGTEIISLLADFVAAGEKEYGNIAFDGYVNKLEETVCTSSDGSNVTDVNISNVYSNALTLKVENEGAGQVDVKVKAETITFNEILEGTLDNDRNLCELSNKYIQTKHHAEVIKAKLDRFITTRNQYCGAEIRFNPLIQLAWLVNCSHADYDVNMNAYIVEQTLEVSDSAPAGRHSVTLLNRQAVT